MLYLTAGWWRLSSQLSSGAVVLQRGPLSVAADVITLLLLRSALGPKRRVHRRCNASSVVVRTLALVLVSTAVFACCGERRLVSGNDDDTAVPIQHAIVTAAVGIALCFSGQLHLDILTRLALAVRALIALAWIHSSAMRLQSPECRVTDDIAFSEVIGELAWLVVGLVHVLQPSQIKAADDVESESIHADAAQVGDTTSYHLTNTSSASSQSALEDAPWWSALSFGYLNPLIQLGAARQLQMPDLDPMPSSCETNTWAHRFDKQLRDWKGARDEYGGSLLWGVLWPLYGGAWAWLGALQAASVALSFAGPLVLNALLSYLESDASQDGSTWTATALGGTALALLMAGQSGLSAFIGTHMSYRTTVIQSRMRAGLTAGVFRQMLAAPASARAGVSSGALMNHLSVDAQRMCDQVSNAHQLWSLPIQVGVTLYLLYTQVSWAALAGLAILCVLTPVNLVISKRIGALTGAMMSARDERVRVTGEVLSGIKSIKMHAWEVPLLERIATARSAEVAALTTRKYLDAACVYLWASTPVLMSLGTFASVVLLVPSSGSGGAPYLSASTVFTSVSLLQLLIFPLNAFPWIITGMLEARVSLRRLQKFLGVPLDPHLDLPSGGPDAASASASGDVVSAAGSFVFPAPPPSEADESTVANSAEVPLSQPFTLRLHLPSNGPVTVAPGETLTVIGRIGSGKSALLSALLGEMVPLGSDGDAADPLPNVYGVRTTTSYAPQVPWVRGTSLRDNIVCGEPWDPARYAAVLAACALEQDIATLTSGDASIVSGSTLSGGQQQRVSLARALYSRSRLVLLDDPISALDSRIGAHVWTAALSRATNSFLSSDGRARVIVTHDNRFARDTDRVLIMDSGRIMFCGPPAGVPTEFAPLLEGSLHSAGLSSPDTAHQGLSSSESAIVSSDSPSDSAHEDADHEEGRQEGFIKGRVIGSYIAACGVALSIVVMASLLAMQLSRNGCDWWLSVWSAAASGGSSSSPLDRPLIDRLSDLGWGPRQYLTVFGAVVAANSVATIVRSWSFARACLNAAIGIHDALLRAVALAPMAFHDVTPSGRLLNRFSTDQFAIDDSLPFMANILLANTMGMAGTILVLTYATTGVFLVALPVLAAVYFSLQRTYRASSREIKRLDSTSKSPLYAHFTDCLKGAAVVRAHTLHRAREDRAIEVEAAASLRLMDDSQRTSFTSSMASQWLSLRLQGIGTALLSVVAFAAVLLRVYTDGAAAAAPALYCLETADPLRDTGSNLAEGAGTGHWGAAIAWKLAGAAIASVCASVVAASGLRASGSSASSAGAAGLALSYSIPIVGALNGLLNIFAETEKELISVERAREYIDLQSENEQLEESSSGGAQMRREKVSPLVVRVDDVAASLLDNEHEVSSQQAMLPPPMAMPTADINDWRPTRGLIEFDGLTVRYPGTLRPAIDRLALTVPAGEKLGLRGRTGSGKSTVISALFCLMPWAGGTIRIDGMDLRALPLRVLRSALAIIPQQPLLLQGTVRYNLDPLGRYPDEKLAWALGRCRITTSLDTHVDQGGASFSVGERQLLCLARALLSDSRVVCVDEATASVDQRTDSLVNEVLMDVFSHATLLLVAHRQTGLDVCTRVATLDSGRLVELAAVHASSRHG